MREAEFAQDPVPPTSESAVGRVVHLSTSRSGGAAVAAGRIVAAQRCVGIDAALVYRGETAKDAESPVDASRGLRIGAVQKLTSRLLTISNRVVTRPPSVLFTPWGTSMTARQIERALGDAQIINLHNLYNFVGIEELFRGAPHARIVATLHDERLLTSGCHCTLGCDRFTADCRPCPQSRVPMGLGMNRQSLLRQLSRESRFSIITPSRWMARQARTAGFPVERIAHIPNPIDPAIFPLKDSSVRKPGKRLVVGWLPGKLEDPFWESVRIANAHLRQAGSSSLVEVLTPSVSGPDDVPITLVPPPETESDRAEFWSAADLGVSMTSADNFPNVVLEALAVGTPFIISDVGGAGEAVRETAGGSVVDEPTPEAFAHEIIRAAEAYSEWKAAGLSGARGVRDMYSPSRIGLLYASHYERALAL